MDILLRVNEAVSSDKSELLTADLIQFQSVQFIFPVSD
jgi:hypothetical protein